MGSVNGRHSEVDEGLGYSDSLCWIVRTAAFAGMALMLCQVTFDSAYSVGSPRGKRGGCWCLSQVTSGARQTTLKWSPARRRPDKMSNCTEMLDLTVFASLAPLNPSPKPARGQLVSVMLALWRWCRQFVLQRLHLMHGWPPARLNQ